MSFIKFSIINLNLVSLKKVIQQILVNGHINLTIRLSITRAFNEL
jgi:hypothetical protein